MPVTPLPFVGRRRIVRAYNPLEKGSVKARFQALRAAGVVSAGVRRGVRRSQGRLEGTLHVYSDLNRDAVRLYRRGEVDAARSLAQTAAELEAREDFVVLVERLAQSAHRDLSFENIRWPDVSGLLADSLLDHVMRSVADATAQCRLRDHAWAEWVEAAVGMVSALRASVATVETTDCAFLVPISQLRQLGLDQLGAAIELEWETLDPGECIASVFPAIPPPGQVQDEVLPPVYGPGGPPASSVRRWERLRELSVQPGAPRPAVPLRITDR